MAHWTLIPPAPPPLSSSFPAVPNDASFLETPCDVLVPAAVAGTIDGAVAERVQVCVCVCVCKAWGGAGGRGRWGVRSEVY